MKRIMIVLLLMGTMIGPSLAQGQQSLQNMIDQAEKKTREDAGNGATMRTRQIGSSIGNRIHYQVSPGAMEAAVPQTLAQVGIMDETGTFQQVGYGFFVASKGFLLSTAEMTDAAPNPVVLTNDGQIVAAEEIDRDDQTGVVLLKAETDQYYLPLGESERLRPNTQMYIVMPLGSRDNEPEYTVSPCSAVFGEAVEESRADRFWLDLQVAGKSSGLPILNVYGEVVGLYVGKPPEGQYSDEEAVYKTSMGVSVDSAKRLMKQNAVR